LIFRALDIDCSKESECQRKLPDVFKP